MIKVLLLLLSMVRTGAYISGLQVKRRPRFHGDVCQYGIMKSGKSATEGCVEPTCNDKSVQDKVMQSLARESIELPAGVEAELAADDDDLVSRLYALHKEGNSEEYASLFLESIKMSRRNLKLTYEFNRSLYNIALGYLLEVGKKETAFEILDNIANELLEADTMHLFLKDAFRESSERADQLFDTYFCSDASSYDNRVLPCRNTRTYNIMMEGHRSCGNRSKVMALFQEMSSEAIVPDSYTYTTLFRVASKRADLLRLFNQAYHALGKTIYTVFTLLESSEDGKGVRGSDKVYWPLPLPLVRVAVESLGQLGCPGDAMEISYFYILLPLTVHKRAGKSRRIYSEFRAFDHGKYFEEMMKNTDPLPSSVGGDALLSALLSRTCLRGRVAIQFLGGVLRPSINTPAADPLLSNDTNIGSSSQHVARAFYRDVVRPYENMQSGSAALLLTDIVYSKKRNFKSAHPDPGPVADVGFMRAYPGSRGFTLLLSALKTLSLQLLGQAQDNEESVGNDNCNNRARPVLVVASFSELPRARTTRKYFLDTDYYDNSKGVSDPFWYRTNGHSHKYSTTYDALRDGIQNRLLVAMNQWIKDNSNSKRTEQTEKMGRVEKESIQAVPEAVRINGRLCDSLLRSYAETSPMEINLPKSLWLTKLLPLARHSERAVLYKSSPTLDDCDIERHSDGTLFTEVAEKALEALMYCCGRSGGKSAGTALEIARTARSRVWPYSTLQKLAEAYFSGKDLSSDNFIDKKKSWRFNQRNIKSVNNQYSILPFLTNSCNNALEASIRAELGYYPESDLNRADQKKIRLILREKR